MLKNNASFKRSLCIQVIITSIFIALIVRLYFIQILNEKEYKEQVNKQHILNLDSSLARGNIFDRNGVKITNQYKEKTAVIFKRNIEDDDDKKSKLKEAFNYSDKELEKLMNTSETTLEIVLDDRIDIKKLSSIKDVIIIDKIKRHNKKNLLSHTLGYINEKDNIGISGIEKSYNDEPLTIDLDFGKTPIFIDARRNVVPGVNIVSTKENNHVANSLQLTIDYRLQEKIEKILDKSRKKGAVVVAEVESGDIISMASRPNIDLNDMKNNLNEDDRRIFNKSLELSYPPGSIFKIPVLLAALEKGNISLEDEIYCKGYDKIGNTIIKCNKEDGHGGISIEEGLYKSCNSTFIQLGQKTGAENIIEMAKVLGFGEKIDVGIDEESAGNLPNGRKLLGPAIGNISIGQGEIEVTPMQVTNMMVIVAGGGIKKDLSLIKGYVTEEGLFAKDIKRQEDKRILDENIVKQVKLGLDKVIEHGTAKNVEIEELGGGGGKTGTAQAVLNEEETTHAWFTGYFPKKNPSYVITVFVEDGSSGSGVAAPIFENIAKEINKLYNN